MPLWAALHAEPTLAADTSKYQATRIAAGFGRQTPGHSARDDATGTESAILHAEFEGAGNHVLLQAANAAMGIAWAALVACLIPFPLSQAIALFLALVAALLMVVGAVVGNTDAGSPSGVGVPELHGNTDAKGGLGAGADVLYVQGAWVYDTLHEGWNEIHPIKVAMKVGCWKGDWTDFECGEGGNPPPPDVILRVRKQFEAARADATLANQARPEHQWHIHPDLDGCTSDVIV